MEILKNTQVISIKTKVQQALAIKIRQQVFVEEQGVAAEHEIDQFEDSANHFLAYYQRKNDQYAIGTARWRTTVDGVKLERFAILKEYRNAGIGKLLLKAVLSDIEQSIEPPYKIYLHAQMSACNFYQQAGFISTGNVFKECDISHIKMQKQF